jgi:hypothetical protein
MTIRNRARFATIAAIMIAAFVAFALPAFTVNAATVCNVTIHSVATETYEDGSTANVATITPEADDTMKISYVGEYAADRLTVGCGFLTRNADGIISQTTANGDIVTVSYLVLSTDDDMPAVYVVSLPLIHQ